MNRTFFGGLLFTLFCHVHSTRISTNEKACKLRRFQKSGFFFTPELMDPVWEKNLIVGQIPKCGDCEHLVASPHPKKHTCCSRHTSRIHCSVSYNQTNGPGEDCINKPAAYIGVKACNRINSDEAESFTTIYEVSELCEEKLDISIDKLDEVGREMVTVSVRQPHPKKDNYCIWSYTKINSALISKLLKSAGTLNNVGNFGKTTSLKDTSSGEDLLKSCREKCV